MSSRGILIKTAEVLGRIGMLPAAAVLSLLASCDNYHELFSNPLSSTFTALVVGSIGGRLVERIAPPVTRPFLVGGLLSIAVGTVTARTFGLWSPKSYQSSHRFNIVKE